MILSYSFENTWTTDGPIKHNHRPYFYLKDNSNEIPKLEHVVEIEEPKFLDSWVNWNDKTKVRKVYIEHPSQTPEVSNNYYHLGFETYQMSIPYHTVISTDLEANGKWPLDTHNEWKEINCLVVDIEYLKNIDYLSCIGLGEFKIRIKSSVDLSNEDFKMDIELPNDIKITQLLCEKHDSPIKILKQYVKYLENTHILIGHNIDEFDNFEMYQIFSKYDQFKNFIRQRFYNHQAFFRGRVANNFTTFFPITWDTLLAGRFLWKGESDLGYGLKQLAIKFNLNPKDRVYEKDFKGWDNWDINNPLCLTYNKHDVIETFELFKKQAKAMLLQMLITGMSFDEVVQDSNGRIADCLSLVRGNNKIIQPPMMSPHKVAKSLNKHFKGKLKTKQEIFDYFITHICDECSEDYDKLMRVVKYGNEMPDFVLYYPLLLDYLMAGGFTEHPVEPMLPLHNVTKTDVGAMYPTIVKGFNICPDTVKLSFKNERIDGWCWFRNIGHKEILDIFEWKPATDFSYSDGEGYFIGYHNRNQEGLLNRSLTGILKAVQSYKILGKTDADWKLAYDKSLKPMRNATSYGVLLGLDATCQQFNIAGSAITTRGQEITNNFNAYLNTNGYKLVYSDTDGSEFINISSNNTFEHYIKKIEQWWKPKLNGYPLTLDIEPAEHKLYFAMKNYVTIDNGKVLLKGHNIHGSDKPKVWERIFKRLMLEIIPNTNTTEELITEIRNRTSKVIKEEMEKAKINDLVIIQSVSNPDNYTNDQYRKRAEIIERLLNRKIQFGGKIEFLVCKQKLPEWTGKKTSSEPLGWLWPKTYVEEHPEIEIDREWVTNMCHSTIDTVFNFDKAGSRMNVKSLYTIFQIQPEAGSGPSSSSQEHPHLPVPSSNVGFFDSFEEQAFEEAPVESELWNNKYDEIYDTLDKFQSAEEMKIEIRETKPKVKQREL